MKACRNSTVYSWLLLILLLLDHLCLWMNVQSSEASSLGFKAVNLGGWLVTEGWITPSLFDGINNKDLLDGTKVQFKSTRWNKYLCADENQASKIVADRESASDWETFKLWRVADDQFHFRASNRKFVGFDVGGSSSSLVAVETESERSETFQIIRKPDHKQGERSLVYIKAMSNGMYLQATSEDMVTADFDGELGWEDGNEAVFMMSFVGDGLLGEYQVTNGLGPERAPDVMHDHWNSFIGPDDFAFIANHGLNAVRIPVGWWTAMNPPPAPFVNGSLDVLDKAFTWAEKYNLSVILDLHAPPYSQNEGAHGGSRDGTIEFGSPQSIDETVGIIEFFSAKYAKSPSLAAVELLNEPNAPEVTIDALKQYYKAGYEAVRRHSSTAYVIMCNRLRSDSSPTELLDFAKPLDLTVIDVHYYNLYIRLFDNWTVQKHIDYIKYDRAAQLKEVTSADGPLSFVGEWVAQWNVVGAQNEEYQEFANAQLEVYGQASFGWAYWTLKMERGTDQHWSLQWMIENGLITL